jgi:Zn-dependent peptidase ImmA (M78 family)/transcriptional regulator with XRE-family HTH domain
MIFGERIEQAREFRELTQVQLAEIIGLGQVAVSRLERNGAESSDSLLRPLALALGFPEEFFQREPLAHVALGTLEFRATAATTERAKKRAHRYAAIVFELATTLAARLKLPPMRLPRLEGDPEAAATLLRSELGLSPNSIVKNLTDVLERAGVFVFSLPDLAAGCDGFSAWGTVDRVLKPAIFVSSSVPGDRQRLTTAHEVGELCLRELPPGREREKAANRFAGALLMPADAFRRDLIAPVALHDLLEIKKRYGVSIQAALVRAFQLEIITEKRYRTLYKQISVAKWRKNEPIEITPEKPRALSKMAEVLYGEPVDFVRLAGDAALEPLFLKLLLATHATKADLGTRPSQKADIVPFRPRATEARPLQAAVVSPEAELDEA